MDPAIVDGSDKKVIIKPKKPTRDKDYYFQNVIFLVGNTLFRVPRNAFNVPGTAFEAMFALPPTPVAEGSTDENPIVLHVDENHFRGFLRVLCGTRRQGVTNEDWLGALELAAMWTFDDIRREATLALDGWAKSQSLKQVLLTAKKYHITSWLGPAYTQYVMQESVPFEELIQPPALDWETVARLFYAQSLERQYRNYSQNGCHQCGKGRFCCRFVATYVNEAFKAELGRDRSEDIAPRRSRTRKY